MVASTLASAIPSLSHTTASEGNPPPPNPRQASFSSYLTAADDESFSLRLSGEFITDTKATSVQIGPGSGKKKETAKDDELDVFGAEKYFNEVMGGGQVVFNSEKPPMAFCAQKVKSASRRKSPSGTPNTCSEASGQSWTTLLKDKQKGPEAISQKLPPTAGGRKFLGVFRCSCSGGSSVAVVKLARACDGRNPASCKQVRPEFGCAEETVWRRADKAGAVHGPRTEDCCSLSPTLAIAGKVFEEEKTARTSSLAAYGAPFTGREFGSGLRRSLGMMPFPGSAAAARAEDDVCSESSSDLFEIDSVSASTLQLVNGSGASASTTCSAPSEGSIEWNVATASASNLSAASDGEWSPPEARGAAGGQHGQRGASCYWVVGAGGRSALCRPPTSCQIW